MWRWPSDHFKGYSACLCQGLSRGSKSRHPAGLGAIVLPRMPIGRSEVSANHEFPAREAEDPLLSGAILRKLSSWSMEYDSLLKGHPSVGDRLKAAALVAEGAALAGALILIGTPDVLIHTFVSGSKDLLRSARKHNPDG